MVVVSCRGADAAEPVQGSVSALRSAAVDDALAGTTSWAGDGSRKLPFSPRRGTSGPLTPRSRLLSRTSSRRPSPHAQTARSFDAKAHELGVPHRSNFLYDVDGNVLSTDMVEPFRGRRDCVARLEKSRAGVRRTRETTSSSSSTDSFAGDKWRAVGAGLDGQSVNLGTFDSRREAMEECVDPHLFVATLASPQVQSLGRGRLSQARQRHARRRRRPLLVPAACAASLGHDAPRRSLRRLLPGRAPPRQLVRPEPSVPAARRHALLAPDRRLPSRRRRRRRIDH